MNIYAISDLHLSINNPKPMDIFGPSWTNYLDEIAQDWQDKVSQDDIVLISGDISWAMTLENVLPDLEFISSFKGTKVIIKGNHDYWWHSISKLRALLPPKMFALQNDCVRLGNYIITGSRGWTYPDKKTTAEDEKIFNREIIRLKLSLDSMQKIRTENDKVIAMMHYPPFNARCEEGELTKIFSSYKVDAVIYGHLHGEHVYKKLLTNIDGIPYYLTSCDLVKNKLIKIF